MSRKKRPEKESPAPSCPVVHSPDPARLRSRAEQKVRTFEQRGEAALSSEEARRTLHELRVHQIELEMQNEELRRIQGELETSRARLFDLYDLAPVGYITLSPKGLLAEANLTAATLLATPRNGLVKRPMSQFIVPEDQHIYYQLLRALFESGDSQSCELRLLRSGREPFWAHLEATLEARKAGDNPGAARVTLSDITERKRAETLDQQLRQQQLQHLKAASLDRFASAIAHHFNNKLMAVMGNLEMALEELRPGEDAATLVQCAREAAVEASEVGSLMLGYLGQTLATFTLVNLTELCRELLGRQRLSLPERITLEPQIPSDGLTIWANRPQVDQALSVLLSNAREAIGDAAGTIHVSLRVARSTEIASSHLFPVDWKPEANRHDGYVCLEVSDTGCGMAEDQLGSIFDPFYTTKFSGRGLGLPVLLGTVRQHRGAVTVESQVGQGSTFRLFFPLEAQDAAQTARKPEADPGTIRDWGVALCVDDDPMVRRVSAAMLKRLGCEVLTARDGIEAVKIFQRHMDGIRFVLLDLVMPRMDGWQTLAELKALRPDIPVILASGHDEVHALRGDHPVQPQAFIHKPFDRKELRASIEKALKWSSEA